MLYVVPPEKQVRNLVSITNLIRCGCRFDDDNAVETFRMSGNCFEGEVSTLTVGDQPNRACSGQRIEIGIQGLGTVVCPSGHKLCQEMIQVVDRKLQAIMRMAPSVTARGPALNLADRATGVDNGIGWRNLSGKRI